ncbi:MAG: hydantoinase/oxoprolinase family protein [Pseudomonadota bacterium]
MTKYRVSADIGGTFTDIVVEPSDGSVFIGKVATTPENPAKGVVNGIASVVDDIESIEFFVHGTTVGLNAFLERKGERVLLLMTRGVGDSYTIARGNRQTLYELHYRKPQQLVPRHDVHEIGGRLLWDGTEAEPLVESDLDAVIEKVRRENIRAVAVCFLHAYAYPQHEQQARDVLAAALPDVSISLSHEIAREWREYERASSAVMNAYVAPVVQKYLAHLDAELRERSVPATVHIMQSNGGVTTATNASRSPVFSLLSGPVGGTIAGTALAESSGRKNLLCVDMGGTSFDLSLVIDGQATTTLETELEGLPLLMSIVDIQTIGTGGGSIAWLDNGAVRVGPHSAGSQPGPACYGRGGTQPTVTDANLYLGRLGVSSLLSGAMSLDEAAAKSAIESLAAEAGMEPIAFAEGILAISNAAMADAMRTITVSQGLDPREFALVAFGGAGPMAAVFLADELDIGEVVVPPFPGTLSAWGMLQTNLRHDVTTSYFKPVATAELADIQSQYEGLEASGRNALVDQGVAADRLFMRRTADMRYVGQEYTINVDTDADSNIAGMVAEFHRAHERRYGHCNQAAPVEFVNLRVAAFGEIDKYAGAAELGEAGANRDSATRQAVFAGAAVPTVVVVREQLARDWTADGPVIIEEQSATTVVPPDWRVTIDDHGSLVIRRSEAS